MDETDAVQAEGTDQGRAAMSFAFDRGDWACYKSQFFTQTGCLARPINQNLTSVGLGGSCDSGCQDWSTVIIQGELRTGSGWWYC